jgi:hypothetical protein
MASLPQAHQASLNGAKKRAREEDEKGGAAKRPCEASAAQLPLSLQDDETNSDACAAAQAHDKSPEPKEGGDDSSPLEMVLRTTRTDNPLNDVYATIRKADYLLSEVHQGTAMGTPRLLVHGCQTETRTQLLNNLIGKPILPLRKNGVGQADLLRQAISVIYKIRPGPPGSHYIITVKYPATLDTNCNTVVLSSIEQLRDQISSEIDGAELEGNDCSPLTIQITGPGLYEIELEDLPDPVIANPMLIEKSLIRARDTDILLAIVDSPTKWFRIAGFPSEFAALAIAEGALVNAEETMLTGYLHAHINPINNEATVDALWTCVARLIMRRFVGMAHECKVAISADASAKLFKLIEDATERLYAQ